jgi:hypothetical protein
MEREFQVVISTDKKTGAFLAAYFQVRRGHAAKVREYEGGNAFANFNEAGELLGIELLAPVGLPSWTRSRRRIVM